MESKDKELNAINSIIKLLKPLDATERSRVLDYVLKRLEMATVPALTAGSVSATKSASSSSQDVGRFSFKDIRSFTAEKQPRSINDMVALVAYYVAEIAPESERSHTINADIIRRYFKMAGFPLPSVLKNALTNAAAAGYLENVAKGTYRLNPVGYNLIVHGLPKGGTEVPRSRAKTKSKGRKRTR